MNLLPPKRANAVSLRVAIPVILAALYLPTVFGFFASCSHCQKVWLHAWPALPGLVSTFPVMKLAGVHTSELIVFGVGIVATLAILFMLTVTARFGVKWFVIILSLAAVLNFLGALGAYALIRA